MKARKRFSLAQAVCLTASVGIATTCSAQSRVTGDAISRTLPVEKAPLQVSTPAPASITLTRATDKSAVISAKFSASDKTQRAITIPVGNQKVTLTDDGQNGDVRASDGIFSTTVAFDFSAFAKGNVTLADIITRHKDGLFASGSRQSLNAADVSIRGNAVHISTFENGKKKTFSLPFTDAALPVGSSISVPLVSVPVGLPASPPASARALSIEESLMIRKVPVVNDPNRTWSCAAPNSSPTGNPTGAWTFWRLMENIANGQTSTSDFIKAFFKHWASDQHINGFIAGERPHVYSEIIEKWELRSGGPGAELLPEYSPFRLLAIAPRLDLRGEAEGEGGYSSGEAGEGRFVFALHDGDCNNMGKTVILEYKVPLNGCDTIQNWAKKWIDLSTSSNYLDDLENLTNVFTQAGANPKGPNQSAIGQIRTNEFLAGSPRWELREFVLPRQGGYFEETDVKQEPDIRFNNTQVLVDYVGANASLLVGPPSAGHDVPLHVTTPSYSGPFRAASAPVPVIWNLLPGSLPGLNSPAPVTPPPATVRDDAIFELALNTCSGCHQAETRTQFAHIDYYSIPGQPALLSGFLTGITLPDPRKASIPRHFNDLARRAIDLTTVASTSCDGTTTDAGNPGNTGNTGVVIGNHLLHTLTAIAKVKAVH